MSVLAAADLDARLVRPSRRTCDADLAAAADVTFPGCLCDMALPAPALEFFPVLDPRSTDEAFDPTGLEVVSPFFAIIFLLWPNYK